MAMDISALNYFMPVFSFLFVFVLIYALLAKTKILGENKFVHILISLVLSIFFLVRTSLVEFVKLNSAWFVVFIVCIFFILLLISFTHGKLDVITKPWVAWVLIGLLIIMFIISSTFTLGWAIEWGSLAGWMNTSWFGMVLLIVIAIVAAWVLTKK